MKVESVSRRQSGSLLERWVAPGPTGEPSLGPSRGSPAGFRRTRRCAYHRQECCETPKYPARCQSPASLRAFPRQPAIRRTRARQAQLGVGGQDQPRPEVGLLGVAHPRRGPAQSLLEKADGVLQVEPPDVGPPQEVRSGSPLGSPPPENHSHSFLGLRVSRGSLLTSSRITVTHTTGALSHL